jgi:hypothetical protein
MRTVPLARLLAEFGTALVIHLAAVVAVVVGLDKVHDLGALADPVAVASLAWALGVLALLSIRAVVLPLSLASTLFCGLVAILGVISYVQACVRVDGHSRATSTTLESLFSLWALSPVLGIVQAGLMIAVPILLVRALRRRTAGLGAGPRGC